MPDNPFSNAFNPDRGGLPGFIGGLAGVPTQSQAAGGATSDALQALSALKDGGMNNQQALLKFFQTPQGHDYFTSAGPDGLKSLVDGLGATTPPAPVMNNVAPGGMLTATNPQTGETKTAASNPQTFAPTVTKPGEQLHDRSGAVIGSNTNPDVTPAQKDFQFFTQKMGNLPPAEIKRLAEIHLDPTAAGATPTVASEAWDDLGKNYGVPPEIVAKGKAGVIQIIKIPNEYGDDTGDVATFDMSHPDLGAKLILKNGRPLSGHFPGGDGGTSPAPVTGVSPATGAATGVLPPAEITNPTGSPAPARASSIPTNNPKFFGDKASMFLGSGPVANGLSAATSVSELADPSLVLPEGAKAKDRQNLVNVLRSDLSSIGNLGQGESGGGGGWVNGGTIKGLLALAPTGSVWETPHEAIQKGIRLSEHVQQEIDAQVEISKQKNLPVEERKKAQIIIAGWQKVQRDLPTPEQLNAMEKHIREGTSGAPSVSNAVSDVANMAGKVFNSVKKQADTVQKDQNLGSSTIDIDKMNSPQELLAVNPTQLDRAGKIKLMRKLDALRKNNGPAVPR